MCPLLCETSLGTAETGALGNLCFSNWNREMRGARTRSQQRRLPRAALLRATAEGTQQQPTFSLLAISLALVMASGDCYTLWGSENRYRPTEKQIGLMSHEFKTSIPFDLIVLLLEICPKKPNLEALLLPFNLQCKCDVMASLFILAKS